MQPNNEQPLSAEQVAAAKQCAERERREAAAFRLIIDSLRSQASAIREQASRADSLMSVGTVGKALRRDADLIDEATDKAVEAAQAVPRG